MSRFNAEKAIDVWLSAHAIHGFVDFATWLAEDTICPKCDGKGFLFYPDFVRIPKLTDEEKIAKGRILSCENCGGYVMPQNQIPDFDIIRYEKKSGIVKGTGKVQRVETFFEEVQKI